ncbi:hypothetical protein K3495_g10141 [Podosphaera aphanis]|nr:hypothetical protein K3495_g10141 [Podosphaera aphanis]
MAKSQHPPPLAQRVAEELELAQRVAKAVEDADPLIQSFVREKMDAFLLAVASGYPMRHDSPKQHKPASPLRTPSHNVPSRPPVTVSNQSRNWAATVASPPASVPSAPARPTVNRPSRTAVQTPTANFKGPKAIFHLSDDAPLLRADATAVKAAFIQIVPGLKDGITSVSRNSSGFSISFATEDSLKLATINSDSIKASLSGSLHQVEDRIGYVVKRIPRTIWTPVSNLVTTTLDDVRNIAQAQTGVAPSNAHWSQHEGTHDPFHTAVIFFPKQVPTFRIVDSPPSRRYIPNPKVVQCEACFGLHKSSRCRIQALCARCGSLCHQGECLHTRRCINCLGPHPADDLNCPLRPRPHKGKLIQPSGKDVTELRTSNRNKLRKARRAEAAAVVAPSATSEHNSNVDSTLPVEASTAPPQSTPSFSQNRVTPLENASSGSMEIDSEGRATINVPDPTLYEQ